MEERRWLKGTWLSDGGVPGFLLAAILFPATLGFTLFVIVMLATVGVIS